MGVRQFNSLVFWLWIACLFPFARSASGADTTNQTTVTLKGLILLKSPDAILKEGDPGLSVAGLAIKNVEMLQGKDFEKAASELFGKAIDEKLLKEIQTTIAAYYRKKGFPLVDIVFPPQTVSNGVLQALVIESKFGKLVFEGTNKWTKTEYLAKNLRLEHGQPINERKLLSEVNWLNRNRFRSIDVFYRPGEQKQESDLVVRTTERFPLGGSVSLDNTGNRLTGEERFSVGLDWGKPFGLNDQMFSYRFIGDIDLQLLKAHTATYTMPLPWRHTLALSGSYADVTANIPSRNITQSGTSYQMNLRYEAPLPQWGNYRQALSLGADYRRLDNNLEFNFVNVFADTTEIVQGVVGYSGLWPDNFGTTFLGAEYFYSPGGLTDRNSDSVFANSFPFAEADYHYARFNLERITRLPGGLSWRLSGAYQIADGNLLPSEQFGLGGSSTVRGYEERAASGTEGYLVSNELRSPPLPLGKLLDKSAKDDLQVLGFFDYGETSNPILQPREDPHVLLMSAGAGLRYQVSRFLSVRFDYGWQLTDRETLPGSGRSRGHVSAVFTF